MITPTDGNVKFARLECRAYGENSLAFTEGIGGVITVSIKAGEQSLTALMTHPEFAALTALFHRDEAFPPRATL